jgi:phenylalanyl-tRNA synthetase beta chain
VIGKILEIKKHPNADRLQLTKVDVGASAILNIVCGAPNISVDQLVPVALEGAILPNGLEIKKAEVRGEISEGMLCALDELGLGDDHAGIFILDNKAKIGQEFSKYLKADDIVLEVDNKSLSNRPDLLCHYGMAREIAALFGLKIKETKIKNFAEKHKINEKDELIKLKVEVKDDKLCPRYMAIAVNNIKITESPKWIQDRLAAVGLRPINNIVDATNYVMLELGQPMHAFDASKIKEIIVRRAKSEEEIETLDGQKRKLDDKMLVITDGKQAVAIAGLMGGSNSEIAQETDTIVIESANFEPNQIRKTSQKLSLRTEASTRFEKSLDPNLCELALQRIIEIIKETCPKAAIASQLVDIKNFNLNQGPIELNLDWLNAFIGQEISKEKTIEVLKSLGFEISNNKQNDRILAVRVPSWRATRDVSIAEDLAEEIARIYGYNNIKATAPLVEMESPEINEIRKIY